jgi:hypothetical protein
VNADARHFPMIALDETNTARKDLTLTIIDKINHLLKCLHIVTVEKMNRAA